ncbi:MAG TPA: 4-hydroxy-3-methylbut-2-enyl diphosphate reductase, partial [Acidimicrobiales bacterium]|nr:4-hydroxy-3-methylbut-2-enyl diphosphate reductase [Acidimicrobiales bacterium]
MADPQPTPSPARGVPATGAPPRLLALCPLRVEAAAVRRGAPNAEVVTTGLGPRRARRAADQLGRPGASDRAPAVLGFGGGLQEDLAAGDLVVATEVRGPEGRRHLLPSADLVAQTLRRAGLVVHTGPVVSTDHVVGGVERHELGRSGALAVDMESSWLAEALNGGPAAIVRAVVDTPQAALASPATVQAGIRAYRSLSRAAGALEAWAGATVPVGQERRVVLAGPRSFCAGVERAIEIVERALARFGAPVYVRKQIVHNSHVVTDLEARGAIFVDELDEVPPGATVVFSAHGVSPGVRQIAEARELQVVDATCPLVAKVHHETRRFARKGYQIMLVGHADHEEIEGTVGEAPEAVQLVQRPQDVAELSVEDPSRVAYLTQTTLATDEVADVVDALRARLPDLVGPAADDICYATQNRQEAVRDLAGHCDLVVVVGSSNSSNSNRLAEVAERHGCPAHLVDDVDDLDLAWLAGARTVGVTAGASAPEELVQGVVAALA